MLSSHQPFSSFAVCNTHWHAIVQEGGFDRCDRFFFIPIGAGEELSELWRRKVVVLFLDKGVLNPDFARKLLGWRHWRFSIESGTRIHDKDARQCLCQYIVRAPLSMQKIYWNEDQDTVTWKSSAAGYFQGKAPVEPLCLVFLALRTAGMAARKNSLPSPGCTAGAGSWRSLPTEGVGAPSGQGV
jgi:hypothetical protein